LSDDEAGLLLEYWSKWTSLKSYYSNIQLMGRVERQVRRQNQGPDDPLEVSSASLKYFSAEGARFRLDILPEEEGERKEGEYIGIITPDQQYLLGTDVANGKHFLKGQANHLEQSLWELCSRSPHAAAYVDHQKLPIAAMLLFSIPRTPRNEGSHVSSVTVRDGGNVGQIVTVVYEYAMGGAVTIEFLRDHSWALKHLRFEWSKTADSMSPDVSGMTIDIACEYQLRPGAVPLLKSRAKEVRKGESPDLSNTKLIEKESFVVSELIPTPADKSRFNVDLLLPDGLHVATAPRPSRQWLYWVNGVLLLLIVIIALRRKRRGEAHPA
jgi:hypothetical protein